MAAVDYYKVLDVPPSASTADIKSAYHAAAKRAHPDAGGSAEAMQLVNEAYAKLSDASARRDYDLVRTQSLHRRPSAAPRPAAPSAPAHRPAYREPHRQPHPADQLPRLTALARASAWRIISYNAVAAVFFGLITSFMFNITTDPTSRVIIALVAYVPVYFLICGIIFLSRPRLRIALARLGAGRLPPRRDLGGLLVLGLCAFPLAFVWLIGYFHGLFR